MMDLDQNLFRLTASFGASFCFHIDVGVVINDYHHLRGGGGGAFIKVLHDSDVVMLAMQ